MASQFSSLTMNQRLTEQQRQDLEIEAEPSSLSSSTEESSDQLELLPYQHQRRRDMLNVLPMEPVMRPLEAERQRSLNRMEDVRRRRLELMDQQSAVRDKDTNFKTVPDTNDRIYRLEPHHNNHNHVYRPSHTNQSLTPQQQIQVQAQAQPPRSHFPHPGQPQTQSKPQNTRNSPPPESEKARVSGTENNGQPNQTGNSDLGHWHHQLENGPTRKALALTQTDTGPKNDRHSMEMDFDMNNRFSYDLDTDGNGKPASRIDGNININGNENELRQQAQLPPSPPSSQNIMILHPVRTPRLDQTTSYHLAFIQGAVERGELVLGGDHQQRKRKQSEGSINLDEGRCQKDAIIVRDDEIESDAGSDNWSVTATKGHGRMKQTFRKKRQTVKQALKARIREEQAQKAHEGVVPNVK